jgi:hypothetical protein
LNSGATPEPLELAYEVVADKQRLLDRLLDDIQAGNPATEEDMPERRLEHLSPQGVVFQTTGKGETVGGRRTRRKARKHTKKHVRKNIRKSKHMRNRRSNRRKSKK